MHSHFFLIQGFILQIFEFIYWNFYTAQKMPGYEFSLTHTFPYNDLIKEFALTRKNMGQRKLVFWHNLRSVYFMKF